MAHAEPLTCSANTYFNRAEQYKKNGDLHEAISHYRNAIKVNPQHFEAHFYLANELFKIGQYDEALKHYEMAVAARPDSVPALYNLGFTLHLKNQNEKAIPFLQQVIVRSPQHSRARILLGNILVQKQCLQEAQSQFEAVLHYDATNCDALLACARIKKDLGAITDAITYYRKATECHPANITGHFELAYLYNQIDNLEEANIHYSKALAIDPECMDALHNKAHTLRSLGHMKEAQECYEKLLSKRPDDPHIHYGYAESLLAQGDLEKGFAKFEWRYKRDTDHRGLGINQWDGSDITGKTILLRAEYGQGDTIQFIRYAKLLKNRGARVIVEAQHSLVTLLMQCSYIDQVIPVDTPLPEHDVQLPLMSLPRVFKTTLDSIPQVIPYIEIDPQLVAYWGTQLAQDHDFKIGICWESSPYYDSFHSHLSKKSIPLKCFEALAHIPGVSLYSLQCMNGTEQLKSLPEGMIVHDFGPNFDMNHGRFMDTAAIMHHLDLVISVDTSVAHLAGALGVPVWVLLPHVADWRWMQEREDSPWYATMRLFRQQIPGDWEFLIETVAHELSKYMKFNCSPSDIITAEISVGELIDKITILEIKQEEIKDSAKLRNINTELCTLNRTRAQYVPRSPKIIQLTKQLKEVNKQLWNIEDAIRDKEFNQCFDQEFIELARAVYVTNDLRCKIKRQINDALGSRLVEEKSYKEYLKPQATHA
jgi:tetratricopeptide (TPR) repeat protein